MVVGLSRRQFSGRRLIHFGQKISRREVTSLPRYASYCGYNLKEMDGRRWSGITTVWTNKRD
jgi:hypothetical protein